MIRAIEIRYFRSGYQLRLPLLRDVNVISGRNDTGKSNILRALNLFFNGQTEWQRDLDFSLDFSLHRLGVVRKETVKGKQFISVEVTFNRPGNYSGSLPETFKVKRTWYRNTPNYSETTNLDYLDRVGRLPKTLNTAKQFLPIFLNRIHYEYVPAVKDRMYYEHLLRRLQKTLLSTRTDADKQISTTASVLANYIQNKIVDLSEDFARATGIRSSINPPAEFADLFEAFLVSTAAGEETVPMTLRGDGIQARYVSSVLRYISAKSNDFFVWGFEEPENSLEYSRAIDLAQDFVSIYSKDAQIFLTTHSPAFTSLRTPATTCYRAYWDDNFTSVINLWPDESDYLAKQDLILELGLMKLQEQLHEEYSLQGRALNEAKRRNFDLEQEMRLSRQPIVLVSGRTDRVIVEHAWQKLFPGLAPGFLVREVDTLNNPQLSNAGDKMLRYAIESLHPGEGRKAIALFDRDTSGIREYGKLSKNFSADGENQDCKQHLNNMAHAMLLPVPPGRENYAEIENLCIEFLFSDEALLITNRQGQALEFIVPEIASIHLRNNKQLKLPANAVPPVPLENRTPRDDQKMMFASEIVPRIPRDHFEGFRPLFETITGILRT